MDLKRIDLNLLVVLDTLLTTRSVGKTAEALFLSQPAVSHALNRLRQLFDDPILLRNGRAMTPSAQAERLQPALREWLHQTQTLLDTPTRFDPAACADTFTLGVTDYVETLLLPAITVAMRRMAPNARLRARHMRLGTAGQLLTQGEIDVAIAFDLPVFEALQRTVLYEESYTCLVPDGHPGFGGRGGLARYRASPHLQISPSENFSSLLDTRLEAQGLHRNAVVSMPRYAAVGPVIAEAGLVGTLPTRLARHFAALYPVRLSPLPLSLPAERLCLLWNERTASDIAHGWLREAMVQAIAALPVAAPATP